MGLRRRKGVNRMIKTMRISAVLRLTPNEKGFKAVPLAS